MQGNPRPHDRRPTPQGRGGDSPPNTPSPPLPPDYLKNGYFDESGHILRRIFIEDAQDLARNLSADRNTNKISAVRPFFHILRSLEAQYALHGDFQKVQEGLWRMIPLANDRLSRNIVTRLFFDFISKNVQEAAKSPQHFNGFLRHFESVIAYYPRERR